jgi:hypothetical protein
MFEATASFVYQQEKSLSAMQGTSDIEKATRT